MRKTPVEDYLEEISTTLSEETYGRLSDAIYETNVDFDQEIESRVAENAKLRELVRDMMRFFEDGSYCTTCEKVAECDASEIYECDCLMHSVFTDRMRELGIEVDG